MTITNSDHLERPVTAKERLIRHGAVRLLKYESITKKWHMTLSIQTLAGGNLNEIETVTSKRRDLKEESNE